MQRRKRICFLRDVQSSQQQKLNDLSRTWKPAEPKTHVHVVTIQYFVMSISSRDNFLRQHTKANSIEKRTLLSHQKSNFSVVIYPTDLGGFKAFTDVKVNAKQTLLKEPGGCGASALLLSLFPPPKMLSLGRG